MLSLRKASERGCADHGWLKTCHSFSFADYYDPNFMGFSDLRVINEDQVKPGKGFASHSHKDMEILSYVLQGTIEHQDSIGHKERIRTGEFQIMSAGTGIIHSEYNASSDELLHFYQIWILPNQKGLKPRYETKNFPRDSRKQLILSPDAAMGSLKIFQNMRLWRFILQAGDEEEYPLCLPYDKLWIQVIAGQVTIQGISAQTSDGIAISDETKIKIRAETSCEFLLFELR